MLDAVKRPRLHQYLKRIEHLNGLYGQDAWPVLYQADMRCRQEHMESIHMDMQHAHNVLVTAGKAADSVYDAIKPWDAVWEKAAADKDFWEEEFKEPALKYLIASGRSFKQSKPVLDGDAPIAPISHQTADSQPARAPNKPQPKRGAQPQPSGKAELCKRFQAGSCAPSTNGRCPHDSSRLHKCKRCGSEKHGENSCPQNGGNKANDAKKRKR
jgi:hypothetical protein